jgi:hypothetical protein
MPLLVEVKVALKLSWSGISEKSRLLDDKSWFD